MTTLEQSTYDFDNYFYTTAKAMIEHRIYAKFSTTLVLITKFIWAIYYFQSEL